VCFSSNGFCQLFTPHGFCIEVDESPSEFTLELCNNQDKKTIFIVAVLIIKIIVNCCILRETTAFVHLPLFENNMKGILLMQIFITTSAWLEVGLPSR